MREKGAEGKGKPANRQNNYTGKTQHPFGRREIKAVEIFLLWKNGSTRRVKNEVIQTDRKDSARSMLHLPYSRLKRSFWHYIGLELDITVVYSCDISDEGGREGSRKKHKISKNN